VLTAIVGTATLALLLFAAPLALAVQRLDRYEAITRLERDATRIAAATPDDIAKGKHPMPNPAGMQHNLIDGIYGTGGQRILGSGPARSDVAADGHDGRVHEAIEDGYLTVAVPIPSDEGVSAVVRAAAPYERISDRVRRTWLLMAVLAGFVVLLAAGLARYQSRKLARPLERLTVAAQTLGEGDFGIRAPRSGVREADAVGTALEATALRLGELLDRERSFSADVSHQLRTPLTGLLLGLESALQRPAADLRAAIDTALERGHRLQAIIDDLLTLARDSGPAGEPLDVRALLDEAQAHRDGPLAAQGRQLVVKVQEPLPSVQASAAAVRQILDVLLDNATQHGRGQITVTAVDLGGGLALEVADEGPGIPDDREIFARRTSHGDGHGIGLALARSLAEAEGGRLVLHDSSPPVFSLLLPSDG
jgi:signal transduction histidine kinase